MNIMNILIILVIVAISVAASIGVAYAINQIDISDAEIQRLENDIKSLQSELSPENTEVSTLIDACIQSSNNMNSAYTLLKNEYESLSAQYYASDDDYLIKENEILRKEIELYKQSER